MAKKESFIINLGPASFFLCFWSICILARNKSLDSSTFTVFIALVTYGVGQIHDKLM